MHLANQQNKPSPLAGEGRVRGDYGCGNHPHPVLLSSREKVKTLIFFYWSDDLRLGNSLFVVLVLAVGGAPRIEAFRMKDILFIYPEPHRDDHDPKNDVHQAPASLVN